MFFCWGGRGWGGGRDDCVTIFILLDQQKAWTPSFSPAIRDASGVAAAQVADVSGRVLETAGVVAEAAKCLTDDG